MLCILDDLQDKSSNVDINVTTPHHGHHAHRCSCLIISAIMLVSPILQQIPILLDCAVSRAACLSLQWQALIRNGTERNNWISRPNIYLWQPGVDYLWQSNAYNLCKILQSTCSALVYVLLSMPDSALLTQTCLTPGQIMQLEELQPVTQERP